MTYKKVDIIFKEYLQLAIARLEATHRGVDVWPTLHTDDYTLKYDGEGTLSLLASHDWYTVAETRSGAFKLVNIAGFEIPIESDDIEHIRAFYNRNGTDPLTIPAMSMEQFIEAVAVSVDHIPDDEWSY